MTSAQFYTQACIDFDVDMVLSHYNGLLLKFNLLTKKTGFGYCLFNRQDNTPVTPGVKAAFNEQLMKGVESGEYYVQK